jgi:hypothetical protein
MLSPFFERAVAGRPAAEFRLVRPGFRQVEGGA